MRCRRKSTLSCTRHIPSVKCVCECAEYQVSSVCECAGYQVSSVCVSGLGTKHQVCVRVGWVPSMSVCECANILILFKQVLSSPKVLISVYFSFLVCYSFQDICRYVYSLYRTGSPQYHLLNRPVSTPTFSSPG